LPRGIYRALDKAFAEGHDGPRQRKAVVTALALLAASLPRTDPRQINVFFKKNLCRGLPVTLGKEIFLFFFNLCRGPHPWPSVIFFIFFKKTFAESLVPSPRQRNFQNFILKFFVEGYWQGPRQRTGPFFAEGLSHCPQKIGRFFCIPSTQAFRIYTYISTIR
jgi:hypothetical protein